MNDDVFVLRLRDPILVRDGRPFSADPGARAVSLPWPLPSTLAGALRAHFGNTNNFNWNGDGPELARSIPVRGPLLAARGPEDSWTVYFPAPLDAVPYEKNGAVGIMRLQPIEELAQTPYCNMRERGLTPLKVEEDNKPRQGCDYWSLQDTATWLSGQSSSMPNRYVARLPRETRVHVAIQAGRGTSVEGALFPTESICFNDWPRDKGEQPETAMLCSMKGDSKRPLAPALLPFGGEGRVAAIMPASGLGVEWPDLPEKLLRECVASRRLKLQLVAPGIFENGWKPGWLGSDLRGSPPNAPGASLRLVAAAVGRRIGVSGWDYETKQARAARWAAPAGSVYFFEVEGALDEQTVRSLWLSPISDLKRDCRDGFGLAAPGVWDYSSISGGME